ncbi:MAG: peptidase U32 family protein [Christensenellales bacterium]
MKPELLSPAGSPEALRAAIAAGADAVYLGAAAFGARATAGFDDQALEDAIRFAHLYGVRVYVTVNTLIKPQEMNSLLALLERLVALRADALIIQDLGLAGLIKTAYPQICVHASTQMSVHNAPGARVLQQLGISRVVLARECSLDAMCEVAQTGIQTEVFVHGAMCVSVSGQCLFSSQIGGRSGNRGKCAQPCRLQYQYKDHAGGLLSMHDLNTLEALPQLLAAGASSFKIEGRLKRAEYVYIVTDIYRRALDRAANNLPAADLQADQRALEQIFSRGFTAGHAMGQQDAALIGDQHVSHLGVYLGRVTAVQPRAGFVLAKVRLDMPLGNGDGLQLRGRAEQECIYSGPPVNAGREATLRLRQAPAVHDTVWKLQDETQLLRARQAADVLPRLAFDAELSLAPGQASQLTVSRGVVNAQVWGETAQTAQNRPLDQSAARRQLDKTGGTPFVLDKLSLYSAAPAFLSAGALNALRRDALVQLEEALISAHQLPDPDKAILAPDTSPNNSVCAPRLMAILPAGANRSAFLEAGADHIITYIDTYRKGAFEQALEDTVPGDTLLLPRQLSGADLNKAVRLAREAGLHLMADNIGQLTAGASMSGEGIPAWNEHSLRLLKAFGITACVLSRELSGEEISCLPTDIMELVLPVYGRAVLMLLNHCPERQIRGMDRNKAGCALCERGQGIRGQSLVDRLDARYPLSPTHFDDRCLISLYHHTPLHLSNLAPKMSWLMDLRMDEQAQALRATRHYAALMHCAATENSTHPQPVRFLLGVK